MKSIFDQSLREELIQRISRIDNTSKAGWGKMTLYQMLQHCVFWDEWIQGKTTLPNKQTLLGKIFGQRVLKGMTKDDRPLKRNMPAGSAFNFRQREGDIETQKKKWVSILNKYDQFNNPDFIHDFFGPMNKEQIGILAYKHTDHHLRQFGV